MNESGRSEEPDMEVAPADHDEEGRPDQYIDPRLIPSRRPRKSKSERDESPFSQRILPALVYPVRGPNAVGFVVTAVFLDLAFMATLGLPLFLPFPFAVLTVLVLMWFLGWMFEVLRESAAGVAELPALPFSGFWDNLVYPFGLFLSVNLVCLGPSIAADYFEYASLSEVLAWVGWFVMPMALLLTGLFETPLAMQPMVVARGIWRTLGGYLVVLLASTLLPILGLVVVELTGDWGAFAILPVMLYVFAVEMRLLGQLYHAYRHELGWVVE